MSTNNQLKAIVERIERLEEENAEIAITIRDVFLEAKGSGFDVKVLRQVLKLRKLEPADRQEQEILLETYLAALGMAEHIGGGDDGADDGE